MAPVFDDILQNFDTRFMRNIKKDPHFIKKNLHNIILPIIPYHE